MTPEGAGITTILVFLLGMGVGGAMMFCAAYDHFNKKK